MSTSPLTEGTKVTVLPDPDWDLALHGPGTLVTVCPVPRTGLPARSVVVLLDNGELIGVNLASVVLT